MKTDTIPKLKIGDKVYCYKNRSDNTIYNTTTLIHKKGLFYNITNITDTCAAISSEIIYNNHLRSYKYFIQYNKINSAYYQFNQYFITITELRKQKLNKLNKLNESSL